MRHLVAAAFAASVGLTLAATAAPAQAYEIDILTRQPMIQNPVAEDGRPKASAVPREIVTYPSKYAPGTILISTSERRMYFILPGGQAVKYGVGVGRPGFEWSGMKTISRKAEWPGWTPPAEMRKRQPNLPAHMPGGINNPLGARAIYIGSTLYRIHGSNEPWTIGTNVSSGCIRMRNEDVTDLYERVKVGTRVVVI